MLILTGGAARAARDSTFVGAQLTEPQRPIDRLTAVMARLRDPDRGCEWDRRQTFATIVPYTIEEAYEVADAVERGDMSDLRDELGDLLLQVVFHARMAEEEGAFDFDAVAAAIADKMQRRHPEIFGDGATERAAWETHKARERAAKPRGLGGELDDVPQNLPGLSRAAKLTSRAARVGFDWRDVTQVVEKLHEEVKELEVELDAGDLDAARAELGDVLFVCANIARKLDVDPEAALRRTNAKFVTRFRHIEASLRAQGRSPAQADLAEMDALWDEAKALERARADTPR